VFSSSIQNVLNAPGVSDAFVLAVLLDSATTSIDRTHFTDIRKLPGGHRLTVTTEHERVERYWYPDRVPAVRFARDEDYAAAAREILSTAVRDRLPEQHVTGVHLSGGLDSSTVAVLAAREQRARRGTLPVAFSWKPSPSPDTTSSEAHRCIDAVARQEGLAVHHCPPVAGDVFDILRMDPARVPTTPTMLIEATTQRCAAAHGVRFMLSGFGGDEGLSSYGAGYRAELLLRGRWSTLYRHCRARGERPWRSMMIEALLSLFPDRYSAVRRLTNQSRESRLRATPWVRPDTILRRHRLRTPPFRHTSVRATFIRWWNSGGLAERMESWCAHGAPHGLTYAYPLADRRLLEFLIAIPAEQFARGPSPRSFMRRVASGILPPEFDSVPDKLVATSEWQTVAREALRQVGVRLRSAGTPARARYVDVAKLAPHLAPEALERDVRLGRLLRTAQFLDF